MVGWLVVARRVDASPPRARRMRSPGNIHPARDCYDVVTLFDTEDVAVWPLVAVAITWKV